QDYKQAVDGVIFLIDATKSMFAPTDEEDAFTQCLKAAKSTMLNKITSSPKDKVGVVLFGTEKDNNPSRFKNVYVVQALECPGAPTVLNLEELIKDKKSREQYGHGSVCLADALWTCALMFSQCTVGQRRLLLLTNEDDPHKGSAQLDQRARTKAKDLLHSGVEVDLIHLQPPGGKAFRPKLLYQDLVSKDETYGDEFPEASDKLEELLQRVRLKDHKKRRLASLPFHLGPKVQLSLSLYNLVRPTGKPFPIRLAKNNNEELLSRRLTYAQDNGEVLMPGDISKYQEYGGKKALFDLSELKQMKAMAPPGLQLLGFKPLDRLKAQHHVRPSHFVYPDDGTVRGSTRLFAALLQSCLRHEVAPVCYWVSRGAQAPKLVYLLAQEEERDSYGLQQMPPGFHVIQLPFSDDRRRLQGLECRSSAAPRPLVTLATKLVQQLRFPYHPDNFENPELQRFWRCLEALALNRDDVEPSIDYTRPNHDKMKKKAEKELEAFTKAAFPDGCTPTAAAKKRGAAAGDAAAPAKKTRPDNRGGAVDVEEEAKRKKLFSLTVNVLKDYCKQKGLRCPAKKAELIECINEHLGL
ncbi:unnamed protein product, partial [Ixodes hexagonus]